MNGPPLVGDARKLVPANVVNPGVQVIEDVWSWFVYFQTVALPQGFAELVANQGLQL